jgi:hypothetical protein
MAPLNPDGSVNTISLLLAPYRAVGNAVRTPSAFTISADALSRGTSFEKVNDQSLGDSVRTAPLAGLLESSALCASAGCAPSPVNINRKKPTVLSILLQFFGKVYTCNIN